MTTFNKYEDGNHLLTIQKLHNDILQMNRNPAFEEMISTLNLKNEGTALDFGEWVDFICKFCMYEVSDMLVFIYTMFEVNSRCDYDRFKAFCYNMVVFNLYIFIIYIYIYIYI